MDSAQSAQTSETPASAGPAGAAPPSLQGWDALLADDAARMDVLEKAFDFRGDVTLTLTDGKVVTGYLFDRRVGESPARSVVRLLPPQGEERVSVAYDRVARVEFGKDAAHGKTFENWVKRYVEKKLKGEKASIESEQL